jgi:hypothetical protein
MNREKTKGGVHLKDRGNTALPTDFVKLLKTLDENYVRTMRMSNMKVRYILPFVWMSFNLFLENRQAKEATYRNGGPLQVHTRRQWQRGRRSRLCRNKSSPRRRDPRSSQEEGWSAQGWTHSLCRQRGRRCISITFLSWACR